MSLSKLTPPGVLRSLTGSDHTRVSSFSRLAPLAPIVGMSTMAVDTLKLQDCFDFLSRRRRKPEIKWYEITPTTIPRAIRSPNRTDKMASSVQGSPRSAQVIDPMMRAKLVPTRTDSRHGVYGC